LWLARRDEESQPAVATMRNAAKRKGQRTIPVVATHSTNECAKTTKPAIYQNVNTSAKQSTAESRIMLRQVFLKFFAVMAASSKPFVINAAREAENTA